LIYSLLEEVSARPKRVSVIATSSDVDVLESLEKRVKSRINQLPILVPYLNSEKDIISVVESWLYISVAPSSAFFETWNKECARLIKTQEFYKIIHKMLSMTCNLHYYANLVELAMSMLDDTHPFLSVSNFKEALDKLFCDTSLNIAEGCNAVELLMLVLMKKVENFHQNEGYNFEKVLIEYKKTIDNLQTKNLNFNHVVCTRAFDSLIQRGLARWSTNEKSPVFLYRPVILSLSYNQLEQLIEKSDIHEEIKSFVAL